MKNLLTLKKDASKGITLIALIITIVVLLILAGVSIAMLTGENGILKQASRAKEETIIGSEKEKIALGYNAVKSEKLSKGDLQAVQATELENELEKNGDNEVKVTGEGTLTVTMPSGNVYTIDANGKITSAGKDNSSTELEGVEVYAKLYSYTDGSGSLLELSSNPDHVSEEEGIDLETVQNYGNIGTTAYKYEYTKEYYEENGTYVSVESERNSIMPPWLTLQTKEYEYEYDGIYYKKIFEYYEETNNIVKVKIVDEINPKNTANWFCFCYNLNEVENIANINTSEVTDMSAMFSVCESLTDLDVSGFETGNVTGLGNMFSGCSSLTELDVSGFETGNVTDMGSMFSGYQSRVHNDIDIFVEKKDYQNFIEIIQANGFYEIKMDKI